MCRCSRRSNGQTVNKDEDCTAPPTTDFEALNGGGGSWFDLLSGDPMLFLKEQTFGQGQRQGASEDPFQELESQHDTADTNQKQEDFLQIGNCTVSKCILLNMDCTFTNTKARLTESDRPTTVFVFFRLQM